MVLILKNAPRVLLIESDLEMQRKITQVLTADYVTLVATDVESALTVHSETPADLVLANTITVALDDVSQVRRNMQFNAVPIIVYSSAAEEELCLELMDSGVNDYLITPFSERQLLARVRAQLRVSHTFAGSLSGIRESEERHRTFGNAMHMSSADGSVGDWAGARVDIERKRAELALRTSEEEFRTNFELAGIGQAQLDPDTGRFLRVNPRFCEMLGYSADELLNMTFFDITYPGDLEQNIASWLHFTRGGSSQYRVEKRYVRKDGSIIWGEITATMLRDAQGQPLRTVSMIQDITERRLSEAVFQSQKSALEMVAQGASLDDVLQFVVASLQKQAHESLVVSILLLDHDGEYVFLGAASGLPESFRQELRNGVAVRDLRGPCRMVFTQKQPVFVPDVSADPNWQDFRDRMALYGFRGACSTPIVASDHRLLGSFCVYYRRPRAPGILERSMIDAINGTVAIVIERKQAEAEREEMLVREQAAREQAESANRVKDEFLAVVSHELRTPLTAITGWADILLEGKVPENARLRGLRAIQRQSRSQRQLIDDLLDVSRIESGKLRLDFRDFEPSK